MSSIKNRQSHKSFTLQLLEHILFVMAKATLIAHRPYIVGITGSVGKTSTKDAIVHVLAEHYHVRQPRENYNNEIGLPLTIIGAKTGGSSVTAWMRVVFIWFKSFFVAYPDVLVLEYGIDRPGDMAQLTRIVAPHVAVLTHVSSVHQEFFEDVAHIGREKAILIGAAHASSKDESIGGAVLNMDVSHVAAAAKKAHVGVTLFGMDEKADLSASDVRTTIDDGSVTGLSFKANMDGKSVPIRVENIIAEHHIYAVLAAIAVGRIFKMNLVEIAERLVTLQPPVGRMRYLPGRNGSYIIDDSYNASPDATIAALKTLSALPGRNKIAILGDMLELGAFESELHEKVIRRAIREKVSHVALVGKRMCSTREMLLNSGYVDGDTLLCVDSPQDVVSWALRIIGSGDVVLVKGSQGMRMEKVTEMIVSDDVDKGGSLPRQSKQWQKKPFIL